MGIERMTCGAWLVALVLGSATAASAGGAWVPDRGQGDVQLGYNWKTARASWDPQGDTRVSDSWHIFRYVYVGGEVGLPKSLSFLYTVTYLDGLEGERRNPEDPIERNRGFSETYLGLKYGLPKQGMPMALALKIRTSYLYDTEGVYDRHNFIQDEDDIDLDGDTEEALFRGVSPEWRGLLGEDYGLFYLVSSSLFGSGWGNFQVGYNYRTGNLGDEIPVNAEVAYPLPWVRDLLVKGTVNYTQSVGNQGAERAPDDRFGCSETNCFPDASRIVGGLGVFYKLGKEKKWWAEAGWNQWLWGRSTRKYEEPYFTFGRSFGGAPGTSRPTGLAR